MEVLLFVVPVFVALGTFGGLALRDLVLKQHRELELEDVIAKVKSTRLYDDDPGINGFISLLNSVADDFIQQWPRARHRRVLHGGRVEHIRDVMKCMKDNITWWGEWGRLQSKNFEGKSSSELMVEEQLIVDLLKKITVAQWRLLFIRWYIEMILQASKLCLPIKYPKISAWMDLSRDTVAQDYRQIVTIMLSICRDRGEHYYYNLLAAL